MSKVDFDSTIALKGRFSTEKEKNGVRAHPKEREGKEEMTKLSNHKNVT